MGIFSDLKNRTKSFEVLIRPHLKEMYYQAYRLVQNQPDAEDLVQDFVLRLYKNGAKLHEIDHLRSWLYKGLYREFLNHLRASTRNPLNYKEDSDDHDIEIRHGHNASPELLTEQHMEIDQIQVALRALSQIHQHIIIMHDIEGFTLTEISDILDTPLGTLKSRLHRARENLKKHLMVEPIARNQCVKS